MTTEKIYSKEETKEKKKIRTLQKALLTWINIEDEHEECELDEICYILAKKSISGDFEAIKLLKDIIDDKTYTLNININLKATEGE